MAAVLPDIVNNYNEASATVIRDYSDGNSEDFTGANLTNQLSAGEVGQELVFDGSTSELSSDNTIGYISAVDGFTIYLRISLTSNTATDTILEIDGLINLTWDGTTLQSVLVNGVAANITITNDITALSTATYYHIILRLNDATNNYRMVIDGVNQTEVSMGGSINTATITDTLDFGFDGTTAYSAFKLNEFKLYSSTVAVAMLTAFTDEKNGVLSDSGFDLELAVGDLIGGNVDTTPVYAIVSWVGSDSEFRFLPISENILSGTLFQKVGHLWDTARQFIYLMDDTPKLSMYEGVSQSSEAFTDAKLITTVTKNGIFEKRTDISTTYTILDTDRDFVVDLSGAAFTATLPASPIENKKYFFKDNGSANGVRKLTLAGNGNNIDGAANATLLNSAYETKSVFFDGTEWFIF